jgi:serine/threonine protein kinase
MKSKEPSKVAAQSFCRRLSDQPINDQFRKFLQQLRTEKNWPSQAAIGSDPMVRRTCEDSHLKPELFARTLDRTIQTGRTSPQNLERFSTVFGFGSVSELIADFQAWSQGESGRLIEPIREARFIAEGEKWILKRNTRLIGQNGIYLIENSLEGKEPEKRRGDSYRARIEGSGIPVFIKTLSLRTKTTGAELDQHINRSNEVFEREQWSLRKLSTVEGVARFKDYGTIELHESDRVRLVRFLVQEFIVGGEDLTRAYGGERFRGVSGTEWVSLAKQLLTILRDVHNQGIRHGDIRPDNILRARGQLYLSDFGQSAMLTPSSAIPSDAPASSEQKDLPDPYRAPERLNWGEPVEVSGDMYSVGGVLLWLATGEDPPIQGNDIEAEPENKSSKKPSQKVVKKQLHEGEDEKNYVTRESIAQRINSRNDLVSKYNEGIINIISGLRHHFASERLGDATDVLRTLELFETLAGHEVARRPINIVDDAHRLVAAMRQVEPALFADMMQYELSYLLRRATEMLQGGRAEISGTRDQIISSLLGYLAVLMPGDQYLTTTTVNWWREENLGIRGRFLTANQLMAIRGVRVRRLFIVTDEEMEKKPILFRRVIEAQASVVRHLHARGVITENKSIDGPGYYVGILKPRDRIQSPSDRFESMIRHGWHIGVIRTQEQDLSLSFSEDRSALVRKIYVWRMEGKTLLRQRIQAMAEELENSIPITDSRLLS